MLLKIFKFPIYLLLFLVSFAGAGQANPPGLVQQKIVYSTTQAGTVYLVWTVNDWVVPDSTYWPASTEVREGLAYSKMQRADNTFFTTLSLPATTRINFSFWVPQDQHGKEVNGWDNYGGMNYTSLFTQNKTIEIKGTALQLSKEGFNILRYGWLLFLLALGLLLPAYFTWRPYFRQSLFFRASFLLGLAGAVAFICSLIRYQLNNYFIHAKPYRLLGALFPDLLWLGLLCAGFFSMLFLIRKIKLLYGIICSVFIFLLLLTALIALINIEVVKQLGAPVNYQWLYYSDFMNAVDAKNAVAKVVTWPLITNLVLMIGSVLILGITVAVLLEQLQKQPGPKRIASAAVLGAGLLVGLVSYSQYRSIPYDRGRINNPELVFIRSAFAAEANAQLFLLPVSDATRHYMVNAHSQPAEPRLGEAVEIENVVVFVMESTPVHYISLYDSSYQVTPNLQHWKNIAQVYTNIYAHIPSTPNSMLSLVSGIYPLISYRSVVNDYPQLASPSLPGLLQNNNWATALFFSSDLQYNNMADYARHQLFEKIEDYKNITCNYKKFEITNTALDGLDDRCLVNRYLQWADTEVRKPRFSVLWTNQTHYPYFTNEKQVQYNSRNEDLNRYLNALKQTDEAFGLLMRGLDQRRLLSKTLVVVVGDHGEAFGSHNQTTHASRIYEENVHIPCILLNPDLFKGTTDTRIGGMIDIAPTITHILGLKRPAEWQGNSLLTKRAHDRTFFISPYSDFLFGTRHADWKYIFNAVTNNSELYNLKTDPQEMVNVASQHTEIVQQEYEMLAGWIQYHNQKLRKWLPADKDRKLPHY